MILVYDPAKVATPEALGASLGIGVLAAGVPPAYARAYTFPPAGYLVARETWKGLDVLPGPVTPAQIAALPDPGPDPAIAAAQAQAEVHGILDSLRVTPIDPVALNANLALCAAGLGIPDLPVSDVTALSAFLGLSAPTPEQAFEAIRALTRVLGTYQQVIATERATIGVLADLIRYTLQR